MKLFDKRAERIGWLSLIASIPFCFFLLWEQMGKIEMTEVLIVLFVFLMGIGILYLVKWYSNK